jgi:hypothetical protein
MQSKGETAQIIPLQLPTRRAAARLEKSAQILFFLGVRYERMEEPCAAWDPQGGGNPPCDANMHGGKKRKRRARG